MDDEQVIDATDTAVQLAEEAGVDLTDVTGTGVNGRIVKKDVEAHIAAIDEAGQPGPFSLPEDESDKDVDARGVDAPVEELDAETAVVETEKTPPTPPEPEPIAPGAAGWGVYSDVGA